jgi:hypothetical protein
MFDYRLYDPASTAQPQPPTCNLQLTKVIRKPWPRVVLCFKLQITAAAQQSTVVPEDPESSVVELNKTESLPFSIQKTSEAFRNIRPLRSFL